MTTEYRKGYLAGLQAAGRICDKMTDEKDGGALKCNNTNRLAIERACALREVADELSYQRKSGAMHGE